MSDEEVQSTIETLSLLAIDALKLSKKKLAIERDAKKLAELTYDIYSGRKAQNK
ncbi:MAG: hypothetical protein WCI79_00050 [Candidatus Saccharibacteria bacterium]